MRIAVSTLIRPESNFSYGVFATALSFFVFAYSGRFGQASILAYYALWLPLVLLDYRRTLGSYSRYGWIFAFAIFACLSVFWSAAPGVTMRAALQYLSHVVCALIAMRILGIRTLTLGAVAGTGIVLVYSIAFGRYDLDPFDGTFSFVGAFASKNQLGLYASLGIYFSFAAVFILGERRIWLIGSGVVGLLCAYCLYASQSATSVITTAAVVCLSIAMRAILMLSPKQRKLLFATAAVSGIILAVAGVYLGAVDLVLGLFGKDSTLTGRTYLWQQGIAAIGQNPFFGVGYQAYWVQGFSEPERLWEEFYIASRSGFHFHNTYIETTVETGFIGVLLLTMVLLAMVIGHLRRLLGDIRNNESYVLFGLAVLLLIRSFVEIDIIFAYQVGSFLLFLGAGKLTMAQPSARPISIAYYDQMEFAQT